MWFAERSVVQGETPLIRAPIPYRKTEPIELPPSSGQAERVQISASVGLDGRLDQISVLTKASPAITKALVEDMLQWEFKPATRDGNAVGVEVVIEIPFNAPAPH